MKDGVLVTQGLLNVASLKVWDSITDDEKSGYNAPTGKTQKPAFKAALLEGGYAGTVALASRGAPSDLAGYVGADGKTVDVDAIGSGTYTSPCETMRIQVGIGANGEGLTYSHQVMVDGVWFISDILWHQATYQGGEVDLDGFTDESPKQAHS